MSHPRLILDAAEVSDAFLAACKANLIRDIESRARLTQTVCGWHDATDAARCEVLVAVRTFFNLH